VAWGAPDWNLCKPGGAWQVGTYELTTSYPNASIRPPRLLVPAGNVPCSMTDSETQFQVSGQTYTYVIPQKAGATAVDLVYEYPSGTFVAFRFR
jgi:hypothetical protein